MEGQKLSRKETVLSVHLRQGSLRQGSFRHLRRPSVVYLSIRFVLILSKERGPKENSTKTRNI